MLAVMAFGCPRTIRCSCLLTFTELVDAVPAIPCGAAVRALYTRVEGNVYVTIDDPIYLFSLIKNVSCVVDYVCV